MPRFVFLFGVAIVFVSGGFLVTDGLLGSAPGVTEVNCRRVRTGMTLAEVESILGGPASYEVPCLRPGASWAWLGQGKDYVVVSFRADGTVAALPTGEFRPFPPMLGRLRSLLGL